MSSGCLKRENKPVLHSPHHRGRHRTGGFVLVQLPSQKKKKEEKYFFKLRFENVS
jgi:hypothetical protein